ncbi:MAG: PAS domain-containing sensor histidine kinase, partial [Chitinophagaceae bacterium]
MRIKTKLFFGVGLLFVLVILLAVLGATHINKLSRDTKNILLANYNTLDYSREMLISLDEDLSKPASIQKFMDHLERQQKNITEPGEKILTEKLAADFRRLRLNGGDTLTRISVRTDLT